MGRKIRLNKEQLNLILGENEFVGHPIGGEGGDEYHPQTMQQHRRTFRAFNETNTNKGGYKIDYETFRQEVGGFLKHVLEKPMKFKLPPFWKKLDVSINELLQEMKDVGLVTWFFIRGVPQYKVFTDEFDEKVQELYDKLGDEEEELTEQDNYPAGAKHRSDAPYNRDERYDEPTEPKERKYELVHMNEEIAILKKGRKGFVFPYGHMDEAAFREYARIPIKPTGHKDEEGFEDYDEEEWEIDGDVIERFVNDNLSELEVGSGTEGWSNGDDLVILTDKLVEELLNIYKDDEKLSKILGSEDYTMEATDAAGSSGSFVTKFGGDSMVRKHKKNEFSPSNQLREQEEGPTSEEGEEYDINYVKDIDDEDEFTANGKRYKFVWVNDEDENTVIGIYSYEDDEAYTMEWFCNNVMGETDLEEATGAASSGAYVQPKVWAKDKSNMHHGQEPWWGGGQIVKNPMKEEDENKTKPTYPGGGFVEFDDCVRFNNNKEAEQGGCSQGAADDVVKVKDGNSKEGVASDKGIYNEVARRTGRSVEEVKKIIENSNEV